MIRGICRLAAGATLLLAGACAMVPGGPPATTPPGLTPQDMVSRLVATEAGLASVRGLASVSYGGPGGSGSATQVIVVALPDRARLETLTPIGTAALVLTIRGGELQLHSLLGHEYGYGPATPETLGRLTRVPVPPGPLLRLLAGLPPLALRPDDPRLRMTTEPAGLRVESVEGPLWQRLWLGSGGAIERGELGDAAGVLLRFQFADEQPVDGRSFPFEVALAAPAAGTSLTLHYQQVRLNQPVEASLFDLPPPQDGKTKILRLGPDVRREDGQPWNP